MTEQKNKSSHILNTSATLLGLCFIVLTSLKINIKVENNYWRIDSCSYSNVYDKLCIVFSFYAQ